MNLTESRNATLWKSQIICLKTKNIKSFKTYSSVSCISVKMCDCKGNGGGLFGGVTSWIKYLLHSLIPNNCQEDSCRDSAFICHLYCDWWWTRGGCGASCLLFTKYSPLGCVKEALGNQKRQFHHQKHKLYISYQISWGCLQLSTSEPYWGAVHLRYVKSRAWSSFFALEFTLIEACKIKHNKHLISQIYKPWLSMTNRNGRETSACRKLRMSRKILLKARQRSPAQGPGGSSVGGTWYNLLWVQGWSLFKGVQCSIVFL